MSHVLLILKRFLAAITAFLLAFVPFSGGRDAKTDDALTLRVAFVSDVHIDKRLPLGQSALQTCYRDMNGFDLDAVAVLGDLTNYGDYETTERFFEITADTVKEGVTPIVISGNHDIGHAKEADGERMNPEALADFLSLCNEYLDYGVDAPYYTIEVNGFGFICLNDESEDNWDHPEYSDAALAFLNAELDKYAVDGKPAFVLIHVPLSGIHGEEHYYPDGGTEEPWNTQIRKILEAHDNVFCLSGHFHKGLSNSIDTPTYRQLNGVNYLNLPSFLMPNWPVDLAINGLGFIMEVTENTVTFRCRNYYLHNWYGSYVYTVDLVK